MLTEQINYFSSIIFDHCFLFVFYLTLNVVDYITGTLKARIKKSESSVIGEKGIIKKISYWILLFISFIIPVGFEELGKIMNINFEITELLGWFILITLVVNEIRSILENLVSIGCKIPNILIKGLEMVSTKLDKEGENNGFNN